MWIFKRTQIRVLKIKFMVATPGMELPYNQVIGLHRAVQQTAEPE